MAYKKPACYTNLQILPGFEKGTSAYKPCRDRGLDSDVKIGTEGSKCLKADKQAHKLAQRVRNLRHTAIAYVI